MKKSTLSFLLVIAILLMQQHQANAQCGQSGSTYSCYSWSGSVHSNDYYQEQWIAAATTLYVSVSMVTYESGHPFLDSYSYSEIGTPSFSWWLDMYGGPDEYFDSFTASANVGQTIALYSDARNGYAYITAGW